MNVKKIATLLLAMLCLTSTLQAQAQANYPDKPVK